MNEKQILKQIPAKIQKLIIHNNITNLKPIQISAIKYGLFTPKNLLISAPSGSGKTLIGQLALAHQLSEKSGTGLYIVPYRALAHEKLQVFQKFFQTLNLSVQALTGDTPVEEKEIITSDILITTYEKCDALLRQRHPIFVNLRCIIMDEIHEINSQGRGARIEMLVMRLLLNYPNPQYLFFSATIGNADEFTAWLSQIGPKVIQVKSDIRPVKLNYFIELYENQISTIRKLLRARLENQQQILIFVNRRKTSVKLAQDLAKTVSKYLTEIDRERCILGKRALIRAKSYAQPLKEVIESGIAYHNASLRASDREIIEKLFIQRHIKVLVATTTLAAGINTPAHTVIITDIIQMRKIRDYSEDELHDPTTVIFPNKKGIYRPFSSNQLFQMLGRAGRMGFTKNQSENKNEGEGIILVRDRDELEFARLNYFFPELDKDNNLQPKYEKLRSHLYKKDYLEELVLQMVNDHTSCSLNQIRSFVQKSLFWFLLQKHSRFLKNKINRELDLAEVFQFKQLSFPLLLRYYVRSLNPSPQWQLQKIILNNISPYQITFTIKYPYTKYHGTITDRKEFYCSCSRPMRLSLFKPIYEQTSPFFCRHFSDFLRWCSKDATKSVQETVLRIISRTVRHFDIISSLLRKHFLARHPWQDAYSLATLGNLALKLYLFPSELVWIMKAVKDYGFSTVEFQISKCVEFYCLRTKKLFQSELLVQIVSQYIEEATIEFIKKQFPKIGAGDIFSIMGEISQTAGVFQRVAMFEGKVETGRKFEILSQRLKYGVKADLLDLMENFPNMSRNKARILFSAGIISARMVKETGIHELHAKTGLELTQLVDLKNPKKIGPMQTTINTFFHT